MFLAPQEKKNIFVEEKKNRKGKGKGKGGKYFQKEKIFVCGGEEKLRRKRRKISGEDLSKNWQKS